MPELDTVPESASTPESSTASIAATPADFELGRTALLEITSAASVGAPAGSIDLGDGVVTVYFDSLLAGYPGWRWTVSIAHVDGEASALETELTPGDDALLSPAWIPWVDRLADLQVAEDGFEADDSDDDDDDEDEDEDEDDDDDDDLGSDVLHGGDLDGVDIDEAVDPELGNSLDDHIEDDDELELGVAPVGVEDSDESEGDSDDAGPEPEAVAGGEEWPEYGQEHDKSY
ncbi:DUF3027 domain-containing protein [Lacisediminihabitans profunda]